MLDCQHSHCIHIMYLSSSSYNNNFLSNREISGGLNSTAMTPQYRRDGCPDPVIVPDCSDSYELEMLMPSGSQESGQLPAEAPEEQSLMASAKLGEGEDAPAPEPKVKTCKGGSHFQMGQRYFPCIIFSPCVRGIIILI